MSAKSLPAVPEIDSPSNSVRIKTNVVVRRQYFSWQEVESDNYVTYIKNLREIGCPDSTIRDIIVADVNALYAHRRATEVVSADHQWWRSEPDLDAIQQAAEKLKNIESERRTLLTRLLGENWETANSPVPPAVRTGIYLSGPVLGELPAQTKQSVYEIAVLTQQKVEAYQEARNQEGKEVDPRELARLRQESRIELAKLLTPAQMEEFLLRYSSTGYQLRDELRGLNLTPDEFRTLFRARDPIDQQLDIHYTGDDPTLTKRKLDLEGQRDTAMQEALGKERFAQYKLGLDPLYRESQATAEQLGAPTALVKPIYEINQLTQAELQRIRADSTLTEDEKVDALASAQAEQTKSLQKILTPEILQQYQQRTNAP
ncbi:MAG: hypothetical protein ABIV39_18380 [Verrucomicrobiota bacterium]